MKRRTLALLLGLILAAGLAACGGSQETQEPAPDTAAAEDVAEQETAEPVQEEAQTEPEGYYFQDGVLVSRDVRIEITDWKVIPVGEKGNEWGEKPVIAFWYDTTNLTGNEDVTPMTAWIVMFTAYQDTDPNQVNELEIAMLPDDAYLDSQMETIKEGATAPCAVAYDLDSDTVPVVLKANRGIGGEDLGEQTFEIAQ